MRAKPKLTIERAEGQSDEDCLAMNVLRPSINAALSCEKITSRKHGGVELDGLVKELGKQINAVNNNEMSRPEAMLIAQAHTLEALFTKLTELALMNVGEYIGAAEIYMRLALKAQSQCQSTLRTLGELKNPKQMAFIKQANVAQGHQQINNTRAETENRQNELLEEQHGEWLDTGAQTTTKGADKAMETVGAVNRAEDSGREAEGIPERL